MRRLGWWQRLLEVGHRRTLSEIELRGLIGELWFLQTVALPRLGAQAAVQGWLGPLAAPHDFVIGDLVVEIKTCVPGSNDVMITSLEQLDGGSEPLYLGAVSLAPSTSSGADAFTTTVLVTGIRQGLETSQSALTEFDLRLAEAGYAEGEDYARAWYHISGVRYFAVRDDFPRLIPASVPTGLRDVNYVIDLRSCAAFEEPLPTRTA